MTAKFLTQLDCRWLNDDVAELISPLRYYSDLLKVLVDVPAGFQTDFASVPRLPIIYSLWGDRAHHEAVIHDFLFRKDSSPKVGFMQANAIFKESMVARGKSAMIYNPMYWGVCLGARSSYHKKLVGDKLA